jgi:non-ribosomal peptide synthetase component F
LTNTRLVYAYGPTENTGISCCYTVPPDAPVTGPLPIGKPLPHAQVLVLDEARRPINDHREGELYVGGATLAHGYLNRPQLTAERFTHAAGMVQRLYRTGDRVRRRDDGCLDLVGRSDRQVKINGRRVELDAIEACLRRSGMVADAAVTTVGEVEQRRIAAFVTPPAGKAVCTGGLRGFLQQELPEYMVPAVVQPIDVLPLSSSGNVDRAALAERVPPPPSQAPSAAPVSVEAMLLRIWREVLGNDDVTVHDNFFDLGGSSLQLEQAHALIRSSLRSEIALMDLFTYPRVSALAAWINRTEQARRNAAMTKTGGWRQSMGFMRSQKTPTAGNLGVPT